MGGERWIHDVRSERNIMTPERLKGFTDAVFAIILTVMVLELRVPHDAVVSSLRPLVPGVLSYTLSFVYLIIYWNNHHHLLHVTRRVTGGVLWANAHLLFWLSLVPFATAWMGENHFASVPMADCHPLGVRCPVDRRHALRPCRTAMAHAGSAHRADSRS